MAKVMTPSKITDGQINKAVANYRALLEKHRPELLSEPAQRVLGQPELASEMLGVLRRRVEMVSGIIIRRVRVNRTRSPLDAIIATRRTRHLNDSVVATMPRGDGEWVDIHFFKEGRFLSDSALDEAFAKRGLIPADPYSMLAVDEDDPAFADDHPRGTHWKDVDGKWCYAACCRWDGGRRVDVGRYDGDWDDDWWFAGLPQGSSASAV